MFNQDVMFERYRLQVAATWPESDFRRATLQAAEASLKRLSSYHAHAASTDSADPAATASGSSGLPAAA
jgi:hypothetical protein